MSDINIVGEEIITADIPERKRVTLHPLNKDGTINTKVNLYPKTFIDGVVNRDGQQVDIQEKLIAGENITIEDNIISAIGGETIDAYTKEESDAKFATNEALEDKANDNAVVHSTGNETIYGAKTFNDTVSINKPSGFALEISNGDITTPPLQISYNKITTGAGAGNLDISLGTGGRLLNDYPSSGVYGIKMPNTSIWTADRTLATTDDIVIPAAPIVDGNYFLKVSVVNGQPTYSWESETAVEDEILEENY